MNIAIRSRHIDVSRLNKAMIKDRVARSLRAGSGRIGRVIVRLGDENGPRGGIDAHCSILVYLNGSNAVIHVEAVAETHLQAISRASERARAALGRTLGRQRDRRRRLSTAS